MSINENFRTEEIALITEASTSHDQTRLLLLSKSVYMNVRKAVARNKSVDSSIINHMIQSERSCSVIYWLQQHPKGHTKRTLSQEDLQNKCVTCDISELQLYSACMTCEK